MKSFFRSAKFLRYFIPITVILFVSSSFLFSYYKRTDNNDLLMRMVMQLAESNHVRPAQINADFSERAFDAYLKNLDPIKWFFTMEDIRQMEVYKRQIADHIRAGTYQLYDLSVKIMDRRIPEAQGYYREILSQPFDFTTEEMYETDSEKRDWPANSAELKESWRRMLKTRVLYQVASALRAQENQTDPSRIKTMETIEAEARERVLNNLNDQFNNLRHKRTGGIFSMYVNAILTIFDPNTRYLAPRERENFDIQMTGQFEGIGAALSVSDGYPIVSRLIPGSPSWMQGELRINDLITRVKQETEEESVDVFGMDLDDAVRLIRGPKGTKVTLVVRRVDGSTHDITITRDLVIDEEGYAKSAILTDPASNIKVGYIDLPGFYVDFARSATGRSAAEDVAKEIEKLKRDGVHGIIIDLRENTGGALSEPIPMGGLFVPPGPIVQVRNSSGRPTTLPHRNPTPLYDGPLVVLVSAFSASSSEIFAAAMQDYKRAVIVGSPRTFGKGTVQQMIDLDGFLPPELRPMGTVALTIQNYYRINGSSVQLRGIESDITLPDMYSEIIIGERSEENHLPWTSVDAVRFNTWQNPVQVDMLKAKSNERIANSEIFNLISEQAVLTKENRENTLISLNLIAHQQEEAERRERNRRFEEIGRFTTALSIAATSSDITSMRGDTAAIARSDEWLRDLNKDIYLEEAVNIIGDMR